MCWALCISLIVYPNASMYACDKPHYQHIALLVPLQEWVYYGTINDAMDPLTTLLALQKAVPRYNPRILPPPSRSSPFGAEDGEAAASA